MNIYRVSLFTDTYFFSVTIVTSCLGFCNLSWLKTNSSQSSTYIYEHFKPKVRLTAEKAVDGRFLNHTLGECAGTKIKKTEEVWWTISLPELSNIYKINLMFRENCKFKHIDLF